MRACVERMAVNGDEEKEEEEEEEEFTGLVVGGFLWIVSRSHITLVFLIFFCSLGGWLRYYLT